MSYAIAIPAFNEASTIGRLLHRLRIEAPEAATILVADSASTDGTADVVGEASRDDERVDVLQVGKPGKPAAWNALWSQLQDHDVIVFIDGDALPTLGSLAVLRTALEREGVIAVGARRVVADPSAARLSDPVVETCLVGALYALHRPSFDSRLQELEVEEMPEVFADDHWLLSLLRRGEFAVCDEATVEVQVAGRKAERLLSARRRLVRHEAYRALPEIGRRLDAEHPEALRPWAQARHVLTGPYALRRKSRWYRNAAFKLAADLRWPPRTQARELVAAYAESPVSVLRTFRARTRRPGDVRVRPAVTADAPAYAALENLASSGGTRRIYGRSWPDAVEEEFREGRTRHGYRWVLCAEVDDEVVGMAAVVPHEHSVDEEPHGLWSRAIQAWRRLRGFREPPITLPGEVWGVTVAVAPEARRLGVGKALHQACLERAHELGACAIVHETAHDNETALAFHRSRGFVDLVTRQREPSILMSKPLSDGGRQRVAWHCDYHQRGFVDACPLEDAAPLAALAQSVNDFEERARRDAEAGRSTVPYGLTPEIEKVACDPAIVRVVEAILRTPDWVVWGANVRAATPNQAQLWHIDLESWYWPTITVAVGVAGNDAHTAPWLLPGTAPLSTHPSGSEAADDDHVVAMAAKLGVEAQPQQPSGMDDAHFVAFDAKTWHRGDPLASQNRVMLFLHYQPAAHRRVPLMVDHARHVWTRRPAPYWTPPGVESVAEAATIPLRERARRASKWRP